MLLTSLVRGAVLASFEALTRARSRLVADSSTTNFSSISLMQLTCDLRVPCSDALSGGKETCLSLCLSRYRKEFTRRKCYDEVGKAWSRWMIDGVYWFRHG